MLRYAITDRTRFPGDEPARQAALLEQTAHLAASGPDHRPDLLQLRENDLASAALAALAHKLRATLRTHSLSPKLLINSRADVAVATAADGVHLTSAPGSLTPSQVRALYAAANLPAPIVSVSCHTLAEVAAASGPDRDSAATLILFGPVFEKSVYNRKVSEGAGLDLLQQACTLADPIPVLALGGITRENTPAALAAGAAGIAAIRLFLK